MSGSLFENTKIILINRASDKIYNIVLDLIERNMTNAKIIINAGVLETRSKLRSLFEKNKDLICIPTYLDNNDTLTKLAANIFRKENISISQQNINLIVEKCNGDRKNLKIEKSIFFGGQKVLNNYCIVISDIMENNEKIIDWEIIKKI